MARKVPHVKFIISLDHYKHFTLFTKFYPTDVNVTKHEAHRAGVIANTLLRYLLNGVINDDDLKEFERRDLARKCGINPDDVN